MVRWLAIVHQLGARGFAGDFQCESSRQIGLITKNNVSFFVAMREAARVEAAKYDAHAHCARRQIRW